MARVTFRLFVRLLCNGVLSISHIGFALHGVFCLRKMKNLRPFSVNHGREEIDNFRNRNLHKETIMLTSRETDFTFCPKLKITHLKPIYPDQHLVFPSLSFLILSWPYTVTPISFPNAKLFSRSDFNFVTLNWIVFPPNKKIYVTYLSFIVNFLR